MQKSGLLTEVRAIQAEMREEWGEDNPGLHSNRRYVALSTLALMLEAIAAESLRDIAKGINMMNISQERIYPHLNTKYHANR